MERTITMLIADDSPLTQEILTEAARSTKLPLRFTSTDNGRECLTLLNGANIDLAFLDVHMSELTGTQAFWSARKKGIQNFDTLMATRPAGSGGAFMRASYARRVSIIPSRPGTTKRRDGRQVTTLPMIGADPGTRR